MNFKTIISALVIVVLLALGYYFYTNQDLLTRQSPPPPPSTFKVAGTVDSIDAEGTYTLLLPDNQTKISFVPPSDVVVLRLFWVQSTSSFSKQRTSLENVKIGTQIAVYSAKPPLTMQTGDIAKIEILK